MLYIVNQLFREILPLILFAVFTSTCLAGAPAITDCDRLAAHPNDPGKLTEGVDWAKLDTAAALDACERAIQRHPFSARIQYQYARVLDKLELYREAVKWYRKAAVQGYASGQNSLGYAYEWGQGVESSNVKAVDWYRKAAQQGYAQAQNNLGTMYEYGKGMDADEKQALFWYKQAAEQGNAAAQRNMGIMYSKGTAVKQNYETAFHWFLKAASQDNSHAQYSVGMSYFHGKGVNIDQEKARHWFQKAANNGNYQASEALHQLEFRKAYCDSLNARSGSDEGFYKLTSQKWLSVRVCP